MKLEDECQPVEEEVCASDEDEEQMEISVHAVAGVSHFRTLRVKGMHGKRVLFILIDSGSTHNFMDIKMAQLLGCKLSPAGSTKVTVADENSIKVSAKIENFEWCFQQNSFKADFMVIPLGGCDMVLGIQWLENLGFVVTCNFKNLTMENRKNVLNGIRKGSVREIKVKKMNKLGVQQVRMAMLCVTQAEEEEEQFMVSNIQITTDQVESNIEPWPRARVKMEAVFCCRVPRGRELLLERSASNNGFLSARMPRVSCVCPLRCIRARARPPCA